MHSAPCRIKPPGWRTRLVVPAAPPKSHSATNVETGVVHQNRRNKPSTTYPCTIARDAGRTHGGEPCRNGAMKNGRCRMHGGKATDPPKGNKNAWKHGNYSSREKAR